MVHQVWTTERPIQHTVYHGWPCWLSVEYNVTLSAHTLPKDIANSHPYPGIVIITQWIMKYVLFVWVKDMSMYVGYGVYAQDVSMYPMNK